VIGHNNWTSYSSGERWNIVFDIAPEKGHHFLMDGAAGLIHSGDGSSFKGSYVISPKQTITSP